MISIHNLSVSFNQQVVLKNVDACFETGKVHGIVGLNGTGKTTLLNTLFGFIKPSTGEVLYQGTGLNKMHISYLETDIFFYSNITGQEYLRLFRNSSPHDYEIWNSVFKLPLGNLIEGYSTGMKKKLALLGILLQDKPVLLLDEPFNGLDLESIWLVKRIISDIKLSKTILLTSHIFETLSSTCDYIYRLGNNSIAQTYSKEEFGQLQEHLYKELNGKAGF
ncbi:ATP-binding cassette domain-containing protein [Pontibacter oryzae]|uniref:ATP-binding cassette domain-containing protein n=1 Tax=Pontibacter oryzae TaxID=2304593 RepID=A0A399S108_9BACT|nr:ATP-binding cassette domain-containing protein [Pontibacter oryzae]RIJ36968.1 ATP-binding cassette domain-containing protein [Pontibacter oryzae]